MATPGWLKLLSSVVWREYSLPPQLFETNLAPRLTAVFSAPYRSASLAELASTRMMLAAGAIADTISTSSAISPAQPESLVGSRLAAPFSLTTLNWPLASAGRPHAER